MSELTGGRVSVLCVADAGLAGHGGAGHGMAGSGLARQGVAGPGEAWHALFFENFSQASCDAAAVRVRAAMDRRGSAAARLGGVWHGSARPGPAGGARFGTPSMEGME